MRLQSWLTDREGRGRQGSQPRGWDIKKEEKRKTMARNNWGCSDMIALLFLFPLTSSCWRRTHTRVKSTRIPKRDVAGGRPKDDPFSFSRFSRAVGG